MGTTTNNGWPTPVATDLVKDGWEAIKDLGDAIDTTLGVYSPTTPGLVKISTTSFSAVSSQSFNDVFSTTYDNYFITGVCTSTNTTNMTVRLRVSGSDASGSNYQNENIFASSTTVGAQRQTGTTNFVIGAFNSSGRNSFQLSVLSPFLSQTTNFQSYTGSSEPTWYMVVGGHTLTTSYTGITLIPDAGTITGTVSIYGYNK